MNGRAFNRIVIMVIILGVVIFGGVIVHRDPFFHYHEPLRNDYHLDGAYARYYNDGFVKFFDYDAIILGTSMCNNFKVSTLQELFGVDKAIKVNASGSFFNETNVYLQEAFVHNPDIKLIVRGVDCDCLELDKSKKSKFAEEAYYLRDNNVFNDVNYILNKKVMIESNKTGVVDWDEYLSWRWQPTGKQAVMSEEDLYCGFIPEQKKMDDKKYNKIVENIEENIVMIMRENPDTNFYLFFTPYSICAWGDLLYNGDLEMQIQAQKIAIEQILQCENAYLFSFCNNFEMVCNLDNYIDKKHYAHWINEEILYYMHEGQYQLTLDNYNQYLEEISAFYTTYSYDKL